MVGEVERKEADGPKAKIFISYSRKDLAFADRLEAALKTRGFEPLIDRAEIYASEDWWQRIQALIGHADTVVFVLSPDAVASEVALKEVACAASLNKRFAPIVCRRVADDAVPKPLRDLNFIFFNEPAQFDVSADRLAEALQTDIAWIRLHTDYGVAARNWSANGRPGGLLLRSPSLEQAERWIGSRPHGAPEPAAETQVFITESRRGATRRRNILTGSLAAGLIVALALSGLAYWQRGVAVQQQHLAEEQRAAADAARARAEQETRRADRNFGAAKDTVDGLIFNIAQGLRNVAGMRVDTTRKILGTVQKTVDQLLQAAPDDRGLLRSRAVMLGNFAETYLAVGDLRDAAAAANQSLDIARKLLALDPGNPQAQRDVVLELNKVGDVELRSGNLAGALGSYQESLDIARRLATRDPGNAQVQHDIAVGLSRIGDAKLWGGDLAGALAAYQEGDYTGLDIVNQS
jgi:tetratricopeptide (TPR) repeat protein